MTGYDDQDRLARELRARSHDVGGHPIGLDSVKRSAHRIQWRRRAAGGAVAAVVLAIAVPVGIGITGTSDDGAGPVGQPTVTSSGTSSTSPSPSASEEPTPSTPASPSNDTAGKRTGISLGVLGTGPEPSVPWLSGTTFHHDGTTTKLPGVYTDVSAYHGGWLAIAHTAQGSRVLTIDSSGKVTGNLPGGDRIATSGDGTQIAWLADGSLHSALPSGMSDAQGSQRIPDGYFADVVGWAKNQVVYRISGGDGASVYLSDMGGTNRVVPGITTSRGSSDAAGLIGGMISYDNATGTSCWAVVRTTGERVWKTCDWALESFSTDGSLVLGIPSDSDGLGASEVALLDATNGDVKAIFDLPPNAFLRGFAWEDENHVLATLHDAGEWGAVRLAADGSARRVLPTVKGPETDPPYYLVGR